MKKKLSIILTAILLIILSVNNIAFASSTKLTEEEQKAYDLERSNYLTKLDVSGYTLSPAFNKYTYTYYLVIPSDETSIDIDLETENENAKTTILGNTSLTKTENTVTINVTPVKGYKRSYTIYVNKQEDNGLSLSNLSIEGVKLDQEFSSNRYYYSFTVKPDGKNEPFKINASANDIAASVEIFGNDESLTDGENIITILLTSGDKRTVYQILANISKEKKEEIVNYVEEENNFTKFKNKIEEFFKDEDKTIQALIIAAVVLLIVIIILIIRIHKKNKANKNKQKIKNRAL